MQINQTNDKNSLTLTNTNYENRKYNILKLLNNLSADKAKIFKQHIPKHLGINRQTWSNWLNASLTDKLEIPSIKLAYVAAYLLVATKELINIPINPIPIKSDEEKVKEEIFKSTGLTV